MASSSTPTPPDGQGRLILISKPKAEMWLYLTVPPTSIVGVTVEKWTTKYKQTYEKHIAANGVVTWWKLMPTTQGPARPTNTASG